VIELLSIFPLLEESANNKLSPFPNATAVEVIVPVLEILPWVWAVGVNEVGKSLICDLVMLIFPKVALILPSVWLKAVNVFPAPGVVLFKLPSRALIALVTVLTVAALFVDSL